MSDYYDRDGEPMTMLDWGQKFEDKEYKIVARTEIDETLVSTVWLGLDHGWGEGPPLIFETMIFGGEQNNYQERYSTEVEAEIGHEVAVKLARESQPSIWDKISQFGKEKS